MPFKSDAQRRFLYANKPKIAKRWQKEYGSQRDLPEKVDSTESKRSAKALKGLRKASH